jgi:hypothetical protein
MPVRTWTTAGKPMSRRNPPNSRTRAGHPLGGGQGSGLGVGELAVADGDGLRGEAGADLGAIDTGQRD